MRWHATLTSHAPAAHLSYDGAETTTTLALRRESPVPCVLPDCPRSSALPETSDAAIPHGPERAAAYRLDRCGQSDRSQRVRLTPHKCECPTIGKALHAQAPSSAHAAEDSL